MCVSPQGRAFFRHLNFKKCPRPLSFLTFWLPNVFFATAACNFLTSELQKVLRPPHVLCIFTSKYAFRHSGVQFLISVLSTYLRTRRFNRPTFGLTRHPNHWKNTAFRDFSNIWRGCIFFLLTFALLHLLSADLTTLLCFSTVHIVGSFYLNFLRQVILYDLSTCACSQSCGELRPVHSATTTPLLVFSNGDCVHDDSSISISWSIPMSGTKIMGVAILGASMELSLPRSGPDLDCFGGGPFGCTCLYMKYKVYIHTGWLGGCFKWFLFLP